MEGWCAVIAGLVGLGTFAGGSMLAALPPVDAVDADAVGSLTRRRSPVLAGSVLALLGAALLLWPLATVAGSVPVDPWSSIGSFSLAVWILAFSFLAVAAVGVSALVWRDPAALPVPVVRLVLDAAHLATWALSGPAAAVATTATTAVGREAGMFGALVIGLAAAKVASVVVEVVGTGRRTGWNAGGWAAGISGYVTVAWFLAVLWSLR
jgi:hypothetical protein